LRASPEVELIDNITAQKKQLIGQLEAFNTQFSQVLVAENLPNNQTGINEYFKRAEAAGLPTNETVMHWQQIQLICAECKDLNEQNGASIELLSLHAKRSLDILKGKTQGPNTYGRDGVSQSEALSHSLTFYL
jgi:flagella synthesis protein FlgN